MLKLKPQYSGRLMQRADSLEKTDTGKDRWPEENGTTEDAPAEHEESPRIIGST